MLSTSNNSSIWCLSNVVRTYACEARRDATAIIWSYSCERSISAMLLVVQSSTQPIVRGGLNAPSQSSIVTGLISCKYRDRKSTRHRNPLVIQHSLTCDCHDHREDNAYRHAAACVHRIWTVRRTCDLGRPDSDGSPHTYDYLSVVADVWYL